MHGISWGVRADVIFWGRGHGGKVVFQWVAV